MLEGKAIIELTDVNTGEKTVVEEKNLITNALAEYYNPPMSFLGIGTMVSTDNDQNFTAGYGDLRWATAGIYVSDKYQEEDPGNLDIGFSSIIGIAAKQYKSQIADKRFGTYNEEESEIITESGTFRHIFDFPTNACNGTIRSLSIVHPGGAIATPRAKYDSFIGNLDIKYRRNEITCAWIGREDGYRMVNPNPGHYTPIPATADNIFIGLRSDHTYFTNHYGSNFDTLQYHEELIALDNTNGCVYTAAWTAPNKFRFRARYSGLATVSPIKQFKLMWETDEIEVTNQQENMSSYGVFIADKSANKLYYVTTL